MAVPFTRMAPRLSFKASGRSEFGNTSLPTSYAVSIVYSSGTTRSPCGANQGQRLFDDPYFFMMSRRK